MARRPRFFENRNPRRSKRSRQQEANRRGHLSLYIEQLEQRMLMNADNNPAPLTAFNDSLQLPPTMSLPTLTIAMPMVADDIRRWQPSSPKPLPDEGFASVENLRAWVIDSIDAQYGHLFGTRFSRSIWQFCCCDVDASGALSRIQLTTTTNDFDISTSLSDSFSNTNVQVEGVDEADLLETDGEYVYLVSGEELLIIDASDGADLSLVSRVKLEDRPTGMYLAGNRLTLISTNQTATKGGLLLWGIPKSSQRTTTTITVLDLTDRAVPSQVQKTELRGSVVSSRMVDGQLRLVLNNRFILNQPRIHYALNEATGRSEGTYEARDEYLERELDAAISSLSTYRTLGVNGEVLGESWLVKPGDVRGYNSPTTIIATFNVLSNDAGPVDIETLTVGGATEVYSTQDSLYLFGKPDGYYSSDTTIWKFNIDSDDHSINLTAKGNVAGTLLNQFSADAHDGFLRVVTKGTSRRSGTSLSVLEQVGDQLKVVGSVDGLAPGEILHSVRFLGDQAFVVTFLKVDPLFAIDLSDPTNPTVAGELKIPGYSDYLQPLGENYLLGIGRDAPVRGGLFQEMQISIFDVSDLSDPQLAHRFSLEGGRSTASIATGGRWSLGEGDHHAVSYFPSEQILAIPIHSESSWRDSTAIFEEGEGGLQVFSIDIESGIESLAIIEHDSQILRSLRIGESLLAFSSGEITSHDITGSINQLDSLQLLIGSDVGLVELSALQVPTSAAAWQATAIRLSATLNATARVFPATFAALAEPQSFPAEMSLPELEERLFNSPLHSADATDSAFTAFDEGSPEDSHLTLDDVLLDTLVRETIFFDSEADSACGTSVNRCD